MKRSILVPLLFLAACRTDGVTEPDTTVPPVTPEEHIATWDPFATRTPAATPRAAPMASASPAASLPTAPTEAPMAQEPNMYSLKVPALDGKTVDLAKYRGSVALVVNVASECGYTKQYAGLEKLWREYQGKGLVVLGFPSNEFGGQEPGDADAIEAFCNTKYGVTFPLFSKIATKPGAGQSPAYAYLTSATGSAPNWNFCKYLVGKDGNAVQFWKSAVTPESAELRSAVDTALAAN